MKAKLMKYDRPELGDRPKVVKMLARSDRAYVAVQVVRKGGENNLHSHSHVDGFWFVLNGRARFYTTDDELIGEFGPMEGVLVPRQFPYWFESSGVDELEMLQFEASDVAISQPNEDRMDHAPQKAWMDFGAQSPSSD